MNRLFAILSLLLASSVLLGGQTKEDTTMSSHMHGENEIDGSQHPELIPDLAAYRLYLVAASQKPSSDGKNDNLFQAQMQKLGLSLHDAQTFAPISQSFLRKYEELIRHHNESITSTKGVSDEEYAKFLEERDALVQTTVDDLRKQLSAEGRDRFDFLISVEKKHMKVAVSATK